ncbi:MAG: C4-dicarboxylate transporter DcuC [Zavarzinella sp.]
MVGIVRGYDVRLCLFGAALWMGLLAQKVTAITSQFFQSFANEKFVIPICTAMGFAYVLKHTGCDAHLVRLLTNPLRHVRLLLIPGVVCVGFLVNIPVISQTSTAVCIGAVVVPLLRAAGYSPLAIGSCLAFGASIGGELLNPGAPELNTIANRLKIDSKSVIPYTFQLLLIHVPVALGIFWYLTIRGEKHFPPVGDAKALQIEDKDLPINYLRAFVPIVPLALLFVTGPPFDWLHIPKNWVLTPTTSESVYSSRLIGLAMLIGVAIAALSNPWKLRGVAKEFFSGAGFAFTEVISLIIIANCFGKAIELVGLADWLGRMISMVPSLLNPAAAILPCGFAAISGSGIASTQSLYGFFVEPAITAEKDPARMGALISVAAAAGRTLSPVAAVVLMSAKLTGVEPWKITGRLVIPLLSGLSVLVVLKLMGILS